MTLCITKLKEDTLSSALSIIEENKQYLKSKGINQWQNGYPNYDSLQMDIDNGHLYGVWFDTKLIGLFMLSLDGEPTYANIWDGAWLSQSKYGVIHRIALLNEYKGFGYAKDIIRYCEKVCLDNKASSLRVDTHNQNIGMQKLLENMGFKYCGKIAVTDGERLAYELVLSGKEEL